MITSENIVIEAQLQNVFISCESHAAFLRYSKVYILNHFINFESCDVMMNISKRGRVNFRMYLLNRKSFGHKTMQINRYNHGQCYYEIS